MLSLLASGGTVWTEDELLVKLVSWRMSWGKNDLVVGVAAVRYGARWE